jgi:glucosamine-6-phosphate deaminase
MTSAALHPPERIRTVIVPDYDEIAVLIAERIVEVIHREVAAKGHCVLGLATGSTPIGVYRELIVRHERGEVSFKQVVTFNLDEYHPMAPDSPQSYHRYMRENLFDHIDIPPENVHVPDGTVPREKLAAYCAGYEEAIAKAGGIDLQILGVGRSGHIGFNEPGSDKDSRTRLATLDTVTRRDAAAEFFGEQYVPREAITMGVATILGAREVLLIATGEHKALIVKRAVEGEVSYDVAATYLQAHPNTTVYLDPAAAAALTRVATPWLLGPVEWTPQLVERAVVWLAETLGKAILKLSGRDYTDNNLSSLLTHYESPGVLNGEIFNRLREKVRGRARLMREKRVLVFSPHPDDDVISMGGILRKLNENENAVTVAYMTSGNIAVFDDDVTRHLDFVERAAAWIGADGETGSGKREARSERREARSERREARRRKRAAGSEKGEASSGKREAGSEQREVGSGKREAIEQELARKRPGDMDSPAVQEIKRAIRESEALAALRYVGIQESAARFLDLPFYRTGQIRKLPIGEEDVARVLAVLEEVRPEYVFVAGDLSDPHGTHRMCKAAIDRALERYDGAKPEVWLYRGAWQEWPLTEADVLVPLSQEELVAKIRAIFQHESQKDVAPFPGGFDEREFWQRVEARNRETAAQADKLGLPEYYAMEAFVVSGE